MANEPSLSELSHVPTDPQTVSGEPAVLYDISAGLKQAHDNAVRVSENRLTRYNMFQKQLGEKLKNFDFDYTNTLSEDNPFLQKKAGEFYQKLAKNPQAIINPQSHPEDYANIMKGFSDVNGAIAKSKSRNLVATDAHKLVYIKDERVSETKIINPKNGELIKDVRYPQYDQVIPINNNIKVPINVQEVYDICLGVEKANKFFYGFGIHVAIMINGEIYMYNPTLLLPCLKILLEYGYKNATINLSTPTKAAIINTEKVVCLFMPFMVVEDARYVIINKNESKETKAIEVHQPTEVKEPSITEIDKGSGETEEAKSQVSYISKEISDLYIKRASLRFTLNALKMQMGNKKLVGKSKVEYDNVLDELNSIERVLSDYENKISSKDKYIENKSIINEGDIDEDKAIDVALEELPNTDYGKYLVNDIYGKYIERFGKNDKYAKNIKNSISVKYNDILNDRGEDRANSYLEEIYLSYIPESSKAGAYQLLRKNYEKQKQQTTKEPTVEEIKDRYEALLLLAEMGDESARDTAEALKLLID